VYKFDATLAELKGAGKKLSYDEKPIIAP